MTRILLADDHDLVRETIAAYLNQDDEFSVQTAANLSESMDVLSDPTPFDLAILDFNMPAMDGLDGLKRAIQKFPDTKFALMSGVAKASEAKAAIEIGALGFFPKSLSAKSMVNAIRFVLSGERYFPFDVAKAVEERSETKKFHNLSARETETLRGLCEGKSNKEIARDLDLQEVTIKLHVKNILAKLNAKNRTHAAILSKEAGFG